MSEILYWRALGRQYAIIGYSITGVTLIGANLDPLCRLTMLDGYVFEAGRGRLH